MKTHVIALGICAATLVGCKTTAAQTSLKETACLDRPYTHLLEGMWLNQNESNATPFRIGIDSYKKDTVGCYWIAQYAPWGMNQDVIQKLRVVNPEHANSEGEKGVLLAMYDNDRQFEAKEYSAVWLALDDGISGFREAWYNRHTKGIPQKVQ